MNAIVWGRPARRPPINVEPIRQCPAPVPRDITPRAVALAGERAERHADRLSLDELLVCRAVAARRPPILGWRSVGWLMLLYGKVTDAGG